MQLASRRILTLGAVALGLGSQWALGRGRPVEGGAGLALAAAAVVVGAAPEARVVLDLAHPPAALPTPDRSSVAA